MSDGEPTVVQKTWNDFDATQLHVFIEFWPEDVGKGSGLEGVDEVAGLAGLWPHPVFATGFAERY